MPALYATNPWIKGFSALVFLKVEPTAASRGVWFRTNGDTEDLRTSFGSTANGNVSVTGTDIVYFWVLTDTSGIVEWKSDAVSDFSIHLLVYIKTG